MEWERIRPLDLAIMTQNEELIDAFRQIKRPLQEEAEKFRVPKKRSGTFVIKMSNYMKFICCENTTTAYLKDKIKDYATIAGGEKKKYKFKLVAIKEGTWILGREGEIHWPDQTICVAVNKTDERLSYYGTMDKSKYGDRVVGRFQNGESFSIYLPEANKKEGNAKSYSDVLPIKAIDKYLETCGLDGNWIKKAADMSGEEIQVEMAV